MVCAGQPAGTEAVVPLMPSGSYEHDIPPRVFQMLTFRLITVVLYRRDTSKQALYIP